MQMYLLNGLEKRQLPIKKVPGGVLNFKDGSYIVFPDNIIMDDSGFDDFIDLIMQNKLKPTPVDNNPLYTQDYRKLIPALQILYSSTFNYTIQQPRKIVLTLFFDSLKNIKAYFLFFLIIFFRVDSLARQVNYVAEIIRDLKLQDILVTGYDLSQNSRSVAKRASYSYNFLE